jgi:hypothetical protein
VAYNEADNKVIHKIGELEIGKSTVVISVVSYKGGPPKLSILKHFMSRGEARTTSKLPRLLPDEAEQLSELLVQGSAWISQNQA